MITSIGRRAGTTAGVLAIAAASFAMVAAPAGAATTNPCKVLKKSEIQQAFGGTVEQREEGPQHAGELAVRVPGRCRAATGPTARSSCT